MNAKLIPLLAATLGLLAGVFAGREFFAKKRERHAVKEEVKKEGSSHPLINPLLDCIEGRKLDMRELSLFKPEITDYIQKCKKAHPDLHISYYFRDLNNGLWMGINEKEMFSPASLMKVPVMIAVLKEAEANPALLGERLTYNAAKFEHIDEESGFKKQDGEYTVEECLRQMIAYSDNAAAVLLLDRIGLEKVNKVQKDLNLYVENLTDPQANFVQVNRYSGVFRILYNASYLNKDMSEKALGFLTQTVYDKGIREAIPAQYVMAHKYGERDVFDEKGNRLTLQLHHFAIVFYTGKPYLIGIMTRGSDRKVKEKIIYDLAKITQDEIDRQMKGN